MNETIKKCLLILFYFFIVTNSFFTHSSILNGEGCDALTIKTLNLLINESTPQYVKNPFNAQRCIPISFKSNDILTLNHAHFEHSPALFEVYQDFVLSSATQTTQVRTSDNKIVKFLKVNVASTEFQRFMINVNKTKILKERYKHWIFFHELMHLSQRAESKNVYLKVKEAIADIAAVLMLNITDKIPMQDTLTLIKEITKIRATDYKKGGYHHFYKRSFRNASKNLSLITKLNFSQKLNEPNTLSNLIIKIEAIAFDAQDMSEDEFKAKYLSTNALSEMSLLIS
jgi:hypothetical protein